MEAFHGTWGERLITFKWDGGIVTILRLQPHQRCSWHSHKETYNQFTCISGTVGIKTEKNYVSVLSEGHVFTVEPRIKHEFQTYDEPAVVEEIAYVKYDPNDIEREQLGGPLNDKQK